VHSLVGTLGGFAGTPWVATEIHLIHSRLGAHPRYELIGTWPLRAGPAPQPASGQHVPGPGGSPDRPGGAVP